MKERVQERVQERVLKDKMGRILGRIRTRGSASGAFDPMGRRVGTYDERNNQTRDPMGHIVGEGNLLAALLMPDCDDEYERGSVRNSSESSQQQKGDPVSSALLAGLLMFAIVAVLSVAPGVLLVGYAVEDANLRLDVGQVWTFSALVTVVIIFICACVFRSWARALRTWVFLCFVSLGALLVGHFGFKAEWPKRYVDRLSSEEMWEQLKQIVKVDWD